LTGNFEQFYALCGVSALMKDLLHQGTLLQQDREKSRMIEPFISRYYIFETIFEFADDFWMNAAPAEFVNAVQYVNNIIIVYLINA
jgi:hypothetical protein